MIIFTLMALLSLLACLEASTSLARSAGYISSEPVAGTTLQSSLALLSRLAMFIFSPVLGFAADKGMLIHSEREIVLLFLLTPAAIFVTYLLRNRIRYLYYHFVLNIVRKGTLFSLSSHPSEPKGCASYSIHSVANKKLKKFYWLYWAVYLPYYMTWPIVLILVASLPEYRATVIGMSALGNGITTIFLAAYVDPKLVRIGRSNRIIIPLFEKLVLIRFASSLASFLLLSLVVYIGV